MDCLEKRKKLDIYCKDNYCETCNLGGPGFRCGRGTHFLTKNNRDYDMADYEINRCYDFVFGNTETDAVNRPAHYTDGKIEVIEFIEDKKLGFCLGNAIKYIARAGKKDPTKEVEDLQKAKWYIERRIKELTEASV